MSSLSNGAQKPATLIERRIQAEAEYEKLYARFGTHEIGEWMDEDGVPYSHLLPPYCYRFDEYFGSIMSMTSMERFGFLLAQHFPDPDTMDLLYLQDILFGFKYIVPPTGMYICVKIPGGFIGPASSPRYQQNLTFAQLWIQEVERMIAEESLNADGFAVQTEQPPKAAPHSLSAKLFLNGYSVEKLTSLLVSLGILTESGQHTAESKPRNWRAVIEALRVSKRVVPTDSAGLYEFLVKQYDYPFKKRVIQDVFAAKNIATQEVYTRACALLRADE
jgi:hypothetical protein